MARRGRGASGVRLGEEADRGGLALDTGGPLPPTGPHDGDELDPGLIDAAGLVDFGSIRVPVPADGTVTVEPTANGRMQAVHIALPEGRLSVSALAAPKTSKLWPELAGEIDASLREGGARVRSYPGRWGRELHATSSGATSVFVGVDGARWMLYGVATGPTAQAAPLDAELRRLLRGTVVVRGKQPFPVRTILPLTVPDHLAPEAAATPAATGTKKRPAAKAGAGKSAPGKAAPGKTAPPNSDAATAAAKKAAARRAAARKAAAAAAVKAAAEALAEQAAEDRAAAAEQPDPGSAARAARTGAYPAAGTIPTGPDSDAPLREQAPSARRAAAAAWRTRPAVPGNAGPPPAEAHPVAPPVDDPPPTEALPVAPAARADLPPAEAMAPTEALRRVEPGSGGRRRLGEPGPPPPGRRHLPEPPVDDPRSGGRRRLREPAAGPPPPGRRPPADPAPPEPGRRRLQEPDGALGATAPWDLDAPGGRRRLHEPVADAGVSASGRRRLREPWESGPEQPAAADAGVSATGRRRLRESWEPGAPVAETGVSASGRRRLREPSEAAPRWETARGGPSGSGPLGEAARFPGVAAADAGVSASGRRRLRESAEEAAPRGGPSGSGGPPPLGGSAGFPGVAAADAGVSASGRRRLREPSEAAPRWETARGGPSGSGGRPGLGESPGFPGGSVADAGVSASGRRRLHEPWDEAGPAGRGVPEPGRRRLAEAPGLPGGAPRDHGAGGPTSGRRRLRESWDDAGGPAAHMDAGVSGTGRRRLRETGPAGPYGSDGPRSSGTPGLPAAADSGVSGTGRRRLRESWGDAGPGEPAPMNGTGAPEPGGRPRRGPSGEPAPADPVSGRRRLREPWEDAPPGPEPGEPGWRRHRDAGADLLSGTGGRRRLREPEPAPPRDGTQTQPWLYGPGGPPDHSARRTRSGEYLVETGEQEAGWATALDDYAERRDGRHSGAGDGSPPTVRLETLLSELDPNRPRRRHRR